MQVCLLGTLFFAILYNLLLDSLSYSFAHNKYCHPCYTIECKIQPQIMQEKYIKIGIDTSKSKKSWKFWENTYQNYKQYFFFCNILKWCNSPLKPIIVFGHWFRVPWWTTTSNNDMYIPYHTKFMALLNFFLHTLLKDT